MGRDFPSRARLEPVSYGFLSTSFLKAAKTERNERGGRINYPPAPQGRFNDRQSQILERGKVFRFIANEGGEWYFHADCSAKCGAATRFHFGLMTIHAEGQNWSRSRCRGSRPESYQKASMKIDKSAAEKITAFRAKLPVPKRAHYDTLVAAMKKRIAAVKTVALYARVSTKDGRQDTENQLIQLRQYSEKQGLSIVAEFVDHETGGTSKRKHFQQMFADARARKFDLVLFWALDRFSREGALETLQHLQRLTEYGVEWRSHTEEYLDSTGLFRDAVIAILAVIAKQERIRRSERASAAIARLRKEGNADRLGRKRLLIGAKLEAARKLRSEGESWRAIGTKLRMGHMTIQRALAG